MSSDRALSMSSYSLHFATEPQRGETRCCTFQLQHWVQTCNTSQMRRKRGRVHLHSSTHHSAVSAKLRDHHIILNLRSMPFIRLFPLFTGSAFDLLTLCYIQAKLHLAPWYTHRRLHLARDSDTRICDMAANFALTRSSRSWPPPSNQELESRQSRATFGNSTLLKPSVGEE